MAHPAVANDLKLTRLKTSGSDPYATLDRFGRVIDQWWKTNTEEIGDANALLKTGRNCPDFICLSDP